MGFNKDIKLDIIKTNIGGYNPDKPKVTLVTSDDLTFTGDTEEEVRDKRHEYRMLNDAEYATQHLDDISTPITTKSITTDEYSVASHSLIGTPDSRPVSWGNYWTIDIEGQLYSVLNMWLENFESLTEHREDKTNEWYSKFYEEIA